MRRFGSYLDAFEVTPLGGNAMFRQQRAIIIALDAILRVVEGPLGYSWTFDPQLPGLLRDYSALGYRIVGIFSPSSFGLELGDHAERVELAAYINQVLATAGSPELEAIHFADDITDPRPLWDLRRQLGVSLERSVLVATGQEYETLQHNAGIGQLEWADTILGAWGGEELAAAS